MSIQRQNEKIRAAHQEISRLLKQLKKDEDEDLGDLVAFLIKTNLIKIPPRKELTPHDFEDYVNGWNDFLDTLLSLNNVKKNET